MYFIRCPANGFIKVGWTSGCPAARFRRLRSINAVPLELVATHPGTTADERAIHARFAPSWSHGEWFRPDPGLLAHIESEATPFAGRTGNRFPRKPTAAEPAKIPVRVWAQDTLLTSRGVTRTVAEWSRVTGSTELSIKFRLEQGRPPDSPTFFWTDNLSPIPRREWWTIAPDDPRLKLRARRR